MTRFKSAACLIATLILTLPAALAAPPDSPDTAGKKQDNDMDKADGKKFEPFKPEEKISAGTVTIGGQALSYQAIAGTLVVHPKDWDDVPHDPKADKPDKDSAAGGGDGADAKNPTA